MMTTAKSNAKQTAMRGSMWTLGGYGASQVIRLGSNLILARLLFPGAFGLMALVNVFMQGLEMLSDIGIGPSIIQNKRSHERAFLNTAWTIQILRGAMLWGISLILAKPAAHFFGAQDPKALELSIILPISGITALIAGFNSTSVFTLNKKMEMRRVTMLQLVPQVVSLFVSIGWALTVSRSVWAIVAGGLAASLGKCAMSHAMNTGERDRFGWDRSAARELENFGRWVFVSTIVSFLSQNLDRVVLGRLLSLDELGLYAIGMVFARVATNISTRLTNTVVFPILAKYQDKPERLMTFALRARTAVLWAGGAVCSGFAIFAPAFFGLLYDKRYAGAGHISQWLALYIWTWILTATIDRIPLALGKPRALFIANLAGAAGMLLAYGGYKIAALPGFICGLALSSLAAHACVVSAVPHQRAGMVRQAILASLAVAAYTLPAVLLTNALDAAWTPVHVAILRAALAALPVLTAVVVVRVMMSRRSEDPDMMALAVGVSCGKIPYDVLKERKGDVLISRARTADGASVIVKLWNRPGLWGTFRRVSKTNTGWREYETLRLLRDAGLGLPAPLAYMRLRDPAARHTESLIEEDLGLCSDVTEYLKMLRANKGDAALRPVEDEVISATRAMVEAGFIDTDHRLPNFVVRPDGRVVRLDFEMARRVKDPRGETKDFGVMLGTLLGSYAFMLQPAVGPLTDFAKRLAESVTASPAVLAVAKQRVEEMLERQRREASIDTKVEMPW